MSSSPLSRRTVLAVPGSSQRMIDKARGLRPDAVFLDLEDAVALPAKAAARELVAAALRAGGFAAADVAVRINGVQTPFALEDLLAVVRADGFPAAIVLPKVQAAADIHWLDRTLAQLEARAGLPVGAIGIDAQIEDARGLLAVEAIAEASPRVRSLVYGPGDFAASMRMRMVGVGQQPAGLAAGDAFHHVLSRILVVARAHGLEATDGPYVEVRDREGLQLAAAHTAALGFDGKWVLHPDQIDVVNAAFAPDAAMFERAERILAEHARQTSVAGGARGAFMLDAEMIDEAGVRLAQVVSARGRSAGLVPPTITP